VDTHGSIFDISMTTKGKHRFTYRTVAKHHQVQKSLFPLYTQVLEFLTEDGSMIHPHVLHIAAHFELSLET